MKVLGFFIGCIIGSFVATYYFDHENAFNAGYTQGAVDQAAVQQELREGICK